MELTRTKKSFIRYIFHELRTPLNSATLGLKLLMDDLEDTTESYENADDVSKSVAQAVEILDSLLLVDKAEKGGLMG
jgi:signal transduction histidine kinase